MVYFQKAKDKTHKSKNYHGNIYTKGSSPNVYTVSTGQWIFILI